MQPVDSSVGITFSSQDLPMGFNREPSPLYIPTRINGNIVVGVHMDPTSQVNIITKEIMLIKFLHKDGYDAPVSFIHIHDRLSVPPLGSIVLSVLVGPKFVNLLFDIILVFKLFRVKLGIPWLVAMNMVPFVMHKCLKFIHEGSMHVIHDTSYRLLVARGSYSLDHPWPAPVGPLPPRTNLLHKTYQNYKKGHLRLKVRYPPSPYAISHKAFLKADSDVVKAQKRK